MNYSKKVRLFMSSDETAVYTTVNSEEEFEELCINMENELEYTEGWFNQFTP